MNCTKRWVSLVFVAFLLTSLLFATSFRLDSRNVTLKKRSHSEGNYWEHKRTKTVENLQTRQATVGDPPALNPAEKPASKRRNHRAIQLHYRPHPLPETGGANARMTQRFPSRGSGAKPHVEPPSPSGQLSLPAILIEFQNTSFRSSHTLTYYSTLLNSNDTASFSTFYQENSYGTFTPQFDLYGPFTSEHTMRYWGEDGWEIDNENDQIYNLAREALQKANPTVDFSQYDSNGDDYIDGLLVIHASTGQEWSGGTYGFYNHIWSHVWSISPPITVDGLNASPYAMIPEWYPAAYEHATNGSLIGVACHEFGHLLGLPDLYDTDYSSAGIGNWGLMGSGSWLGITLGSNPAHLSVWSKKVLGWADPTPLTDAGQYAISPTEETSQVYQYDIPSSNEYFLLSYRSTLTNARFDAHLPGSGILIWHIDDSVENNNNEQHYMVDLEEFDQHDGTQELETGENLGEASDPWKATDIGFTVTTTPNSRPYTGENSYLVLMNISPIRDPMHFEVIRDTVSPVLSLSHPTNGSILSTSSVTVEWEGNDTNSGIAFYLLSLGDWYERRVVNKTYTFPYLWDSNHYMTVLAVDYAGNSAKEAITFTVNAMPDSDHDRMLDSWELRHGLNQSNPTDAEEDPDNDGLTNLQEYQHGTDPRNSDSDYDSVSDGKEVDVGTDPTDAGSTPIAGMKPMTFYGIITGVIAVVALGVVVYMLKK